MAGEAASAGSGALVAAAAVVDPLAGATTLAIGGSGAAATLPGGWAAAAPSGIQLRLAHSADAGLLTTLVTSSTASVPATTASAAGRALLAAAPAMDGALSVTVVSGEGWLGVWAVRGSWGCGQSGAVLSWQELCAQPHAIPSTLPSHQGWSTSPPRLPAPARWTWLCPSTPTMWPAM